LKTNRTEYGFEITSSLIGIARFSLETAMALITS